MRLLRLFVVTWALAAWILVAPRAFAVGAVPGNPEWSTKPDHALNVIGQRDCVDNLSITFDVNITAAASNLFQVWAGTTCDQKESRDENKDCFRVFEGAADSTEPVTVEIQDIVQPVSESANENTGSESACETSSSATGETPRSLYFLVLSEADQSTLGTAGVWKFTFDMNAPVAPTGLTADAAENALAVKFKASTSNDVAKYRYFCSNIAAEEGEGAEGADGSCTSSVLVAGEDPPLDRGCGSTNATGAGSGETSSSLKNDQLYAVAVAAEDKYGNLSPLSNVACGTPVDVTGYYEAYSAAGGQAGGGFCSFGPARRGAVPIALGLALALVAVARRRR